MSSAIHVGDCRDVMRGMEDASFSACVTDPPYGLSEHRPEDVVACLRAWLDDNEYTPKKRGFMGKAWDGWVPGPSYWREAYRVLKPGGHLVCFAGSRTSDLMGIAIRLAGFEVRDTCCFLYGSGFPKSHDVSKAIDKAAGAERVPVLVPTKPHNKREQAGPIACGATGITDISKPATDAAREFSGFGSALKPAWEPIILARKPLSGTIASNVLEHGCGALNIAACRVATPDSLNGGAYSSNGTERADSWGMQRGGAGEYQQPAGRWPANLLLHCACTVEHEPDCAVAMLDAQSGELTTGAWDGNRNTPKLGASVFNSYEGDKEPGRHATVGGASRFFYTSKASRDERERGLEHRQQRVVHDGRKTPIDNPYLRAETKRGNTHPTVKPVSLMRWLVRLVGCKRGSRVLDPFCGSGTTGVACELEGFSFVGIDLDPDHCAIARARILSAAEEAGTATAEHLETVPERRGPVQMGLQLDGVEP